MDLTDFWYKGFGKINKDLFEESLIKIKAKEESVCEDTEEKSEWKLEDNLSSNTSIIEKL